jgi:protein SCO1/2
VKKVLLVLFVLVEPLLAMASTPDASIYQLNVALVNQTNQSIHLDVYRGKPTLITMFYASCPNVCPLLIDTLRNVESSLDQNQRTQLRVLLVSIDPDRDTPAALAHLAATRKIDTTRWTLATAKANEIRKLAAVLNVQYRQLPNGEFNHSSVIVLLDPEGKAIDSTSKLGSPDPQFVANVRKSIDR